MNIHTLFLKYIPGPIELLDSTRKSAFVKAINGINRAAVIDIFSELYIYSFMPVGH